MQVTFDPQEISFRELPKVFFTIHDPTTPNCQGADVGPQYRSISLYHSPEQRETAGEVIAELERHGIWSDPVVTEIKRWRRSIRPRKSTRDTTAETRARDTAVW